MGAIFRFALRITMLMVFSFLHFVSFSYGEGFSKASIHPVIVLAQANASDPTTISPSHFDRAMAAVQTGNDPEALNEIQLAIASEPSNLEYQYLLGNIYFRLNRIEEAENIYNALLRTRPDQYQKCFFDLAAICLRRNDETGALENLEKAKVLDSGRASYESGLVYMRLKKFEKALSSFDLAMVEKPSIAYECLMQKASAYAQLQQSNKAKGILQEILAMDVSSDRKEAAMRFLEELDTGMRSERRWFLSVNVGVQYDDNVFQQPLEQVISSVTTQGTKEKSDTAYLATLYGKYDIWKEGSWKSGISYLHYQLLYETVRENNLLGSRPSIYLEYGNSPVYANVEYTFSHYWVDNDPRVDVHGIYPRLLWIHNDQFRSEVYGGIERRLYLDTTPDDWHPFTGITEYWMMSKGMAHLRVGYLFDYNDFSNEERGDMAGHRFSVGTNFPVYRDKVFIDIEGVYQMRHYQFDPNIDTDEKRNDNEFHTNIQLYGHINKNFDIRIGYFQTWNESNVVNDFDVDPYHFRRGVSLLMLSYIF